MNIEALNQKMFADAVKQLNNSRKGFREEYSAFIRSNTDLEEGARVLDVGCGLGFLAKTIEKIVNSLERRRWSQAQLFDFSHNKNTIL